VLMREPSGSVLPYPVEVLLRFAQGCAIGA
jgi:hypothetical protein